MPRYSRNALNGNFFHVIVQGLNKEYIFYQDIYKKKYKQLLIKESREYNIQIIAYCIMNNHTHILIFTESIEDMSKCMHKINTNYARFYNKENDRVGFVFRDRYYTQPVMNEKHLLTCIAYIHKNPVKAGLVENESEYEYSSYNEYINKAERQVISNEAEKIAFNTEDPVKVKEMFEFIHKMRLEETEILEIDEKVDYNTIIEKYKIENATTEEIVLQLHYAHKLSTRNIAMLLKISRYRVRKILDDNKKIS